MGSFWSPNLTLLLPGGSVGKESACSAGDLGLLHGWGRSPGEGNGNPLQYSCLENSMDCQELVRLDLGTKPHQPCRFQGLQPGETWQDSETLENKGRFSFQCWDWGTGIHSLNTAF